ncbi:hypothetical protein LCGC14_2573040, partial [marine sediment metagenome]
QHNRSDVHWDNFDDLFPYNLFPDERNDWLVDLNSNTEYDHKIITYCATWKGRNFLDDNYAYSLGFIVMQEMGIIRMDEEIRRNDGIVPLSSAMFKGHNTKAIRMFSPYNHTRIAKGNDGISDFLFLTLKNDLLENAISFMSILPDNSIDFGVIGVSESFNEKIQIFNSGDSPLAITSISIDGANSEQFSLNGISTPFSLSARESKEISISFNPTSAGSKTAVIKISNDSENIGPETEINLSAEATDEAMKSIEFSPTVSWDFGASQVNFSTTQIFIISNTGEADVDVSDIVFSGTNPDQFGIISPASSSFTGK